MSVMFAADTSRGPNRRAVLAVLFILELRKGQDPYLAFEEQTPYLFATTRSVEVSQKTHGSLKGFMYARAPSHHAR